MRACDVCMFVCFQILAHPAVKAVVSHCGMGAAQEALVFGKPVLCLPMLADQEVSYI